jgi:hypothetical protein
MEPSRTRLAPGLIRWTQEPDRGDRRLVIVHISPSGDPAAAVAELKRLGAVVHHAGPGLVTALVTRALANEVAEQPWVLAVVDPTPMFPVPLSSSMPAS